jgi:hypothetical protein
MVNPAFTSENEMFNSESKVLGKRQTSRRQTIPIEMMVIKRRKSRIPMFLDEIGFWFSIAKIFNRATHPHDAMHSLTMHHDHKYLCNNESFDSHPPMLYSKPDEPELALADGSYNPQDCLLLPK